MRCGLGDPARDRLDDLIPLQFFERRLDLRVLLQVVYRNGLARHLRGVAGGDAHPRAEGSLEAVVRAFIQELA